MKRILSTALAILLFVGASQAQSTAEGKGRHHGKGSEMAKELNLSAEQKAKLKSIHEAEKKDMQALKSDGRTEADRVARKEIHEKYRIQIESVLTAEQKAKFKEERKEFKDGRMDKADRKEDGREFGQELNLSADQKTKVASLNQEFKTKMNGVKSNTSLSADEKKAQMKNLAEAHRNSLKTILTPEQAGKMKSMNKDRHRNNKNEVK